MIDELGKQGSRLAGTGGQSSTGYINNFGSIATVIAFFQFELNQNWSNARITRCRQSWQLIFLLKSDMLSNQHNKRQQKVLISHVVAFRRI